MLQSLASSAVIQLQVVAAFWSHYVVAAKQGPNALLLTLTGVACFTNRSEHGKGLTL